MGAQLDTREAQLDEILDRLYDEYPDATISLNFSNRLELLIAVMLSAQCTDERVNKETAHLFEKYQSPEDYASADVDELAEDLNSITYYNNKAKWINSACRTIIEEHDGEVPDTMRELTDLTGVGRKTANVVLQHGHDVVEGIVVDTHVQRLSRRLGLTDEQSPQNIESDLMTFVPEADWQWLTHLFISHGRATCTARSPDCKGCVLEDICPSSKVDNDIDLASGEAWN
ncbi:endonuclease III [Haladaptatus caseinilyticus]|uniref:endonuclease III n=1 Tax=Haladaptatus caseinilyticus TaxID=2993314 RepID=UPI00224AB8FB|nr:endonuclease III [Haladaptatus caseinilyticus]